MVSVKMHELFYDHPEYYQFVDFDKLSNEYGIEVRNNIETRMVQKHYSNLQYITKQSKFIQLFAVQQNGLAILYVPLSDINYQLQLEAIKHSEGNQTKKILEYYYDKNIMPTEKEQLIELCLTAIKICPKNIMSMIPPSEVIMEAITGKSSTKLTIEIDDQLEEIIHYLCSNRIPMSEDIQLEAVRRCPKAIKIMYKTEMFPSQLVQLEAVRLYEKSIKYMYSASMKPSLKVQIESVKYYPHSIKYMYVMTHKPNVRIQVIAVRRDGSTIQHMFMKASNAKPPLIVQLEAVRCDPHSIQYMYSKNHLYCYKPSKEVQIEAINYDPQTIRFMYTGYPFYFKPSIEIQLEAVKRGARIEYLYSCDSMPCQEVQIEAIKKNKNAVYHIKHLTDNVVIEAVKQGIDLVHMMSNPLADKKYQPSEKVQTFYKKHTLLNFANNHPDIVKKLYKVKYQFC